MYDGLRIGVNKLPIIVGGGILGIAVAGLAAASFGAALPLIVEAGAALAGATIANRYS